MQIVIVRDLDCCLGRGLTGRGGGGGAIVELIDQLNPLIDDVGQEVEEEEEEEVVVVCLSSPLARLLSAEFA